MIKPAALLWLGPAALLAAFGCNDFTGADDLEVGRRHRDGDDSNVFGEGGASSSDGWGGDPVSLGTGGAGEPPDSGSGPIDVPLGSAPGVSVTEISLYQAVKIELMKQGQKTAPSVPVVSGKDALVRVFVATDPAYDGSSITARLTVDGAPPVEATAAISGISTESKLGSTINIEVPGASIVPGAGYRLEIGRIGASGTALSYPEVGSEPLGAQSAGAVLKVHLVPIAYGGDGSNRLPDVSAAQLARYERRFSSMYPVPKVEISVHEPVKWGSKVAPNGSGWESLLDAIASLREQENTPDDVYFYGIFAPASSFGQYCGGGCVAGLGMIGGPNDVYTRAAIGLGFSGDDATDTAIHEIGHTHGRQHAPCQVGNYDPQYPHDNGAIGRWGYDRVTKQLVPPNTADLMGYCFPIWISDYNYKAIFNRIKTVNAARLVAPPEAEDRVYERIRVDEGGALSWKEPIRLRQPPLGETFMAMVESEAGVADVEATFYPYDHLPGGVLLLPRPPDPLEAVSIELDGKVHSLLK